MKTLWIIDVLRKQMSLTNQNYQQTSIRILLDLQTLYVFFKTLEFNNERQKDILNDDLHPFPNGAEELAIVLQV